MTQARPHIAVIGAGIGGLAAALRLAHSGARVTVFERHAAPGGKMRTVTSAAGPIDAGPTVLTLKHVFEDLFTETGSALSDHVTLHAAPVLARHFWPDGTQFDLSTDTGANIETIGQTFGPKAAAEFERFNARAARLFEAFDAPIMRNPSPGLASLAAHVLRKPALIPQMESHRSLLRSLSRQFSEPKLVQLFGRYATYVGGIPQASPALLGLIWHAESQGVWHVEGGMHRLAQAIAKRAEVLGAKFLYRAHVSRVEVQDGRPTAVITQGGRTSVDAVLFNGDPRALWTGMLGQSLRGAVQKLAVAPRSLSAYVHSFAATAQGLPLASHNVLFCTDPRQEFGPLAKGAAPQNATLYICAQDRATGHTPTGPERFEIITNAPPAADGASLHPKEKDTCHKIILARLQPFGLRFSPEPDMDSLTMPEQFAALFPASNGALYGRSPHGMMAAFKRPQVRSRIPGLYLVGGGVHPGAGVPMATLCAAHAAAAMINDLSLTSTSRQAAMPGGMSMASPTMVGAPSLSSDS